MKPSTSLRSLIAAGAIALIPASAPAGAPVTFSSNRGSGIVNLQSDGTTPINASFTFEVGSFARLPDGTQFAPSLGNVSEWATHWNPLASTSYLGAPNNFFNGQASLESNAAPFSAADTPYIWGYDSREGTAEWILLRRDGDTPWTWPNSDGGGITPVGTFFTISDTLPGISAVIGRIAGDGFLMKTQSISLPLAGETYDEWANAIFDAADLADPTISGKTADPDGDGFSNFVEFATGTLPQNASGSPTFLQEITGAGHLQLSISENPAALVTWNLQVSTDLITWETFTPSIAGTPDGTKRTFIDPAPIGASQRRFLRVSVEE